MLFGIIIGPGIKKDKVLYFNNTAKNFYEVICQTPNVQNAFSENPSAFLLGESACNNDIILYSTTGNSIISQGNAPYSGGYWAMKVADNTPVEVWFSTHPLNQDDLRPYSVAEQNSSMRLFEDVSDSKVIGYYALNSPEDE